jgi:hypothetical protein
VLCVPKSFQRSDECNPCTLVVVLYFAFLDLDSVPSPASAFLVRCAPDCLVSLTPVVEPLENDCEKIWKYLGLSNSLVERDEAEADATLSVRHEQPLPPFKPSHFSVAQAPLSQTSITMASSEHTTTSGKVESVKSTDISRDVIDPTRDRPNYLTSNQGVKISDTDNW